MHHSTKQPKKNHKWTYDPEVEAKLVDMVKNETDIIKIYDYLNEKFTDDRTKWNNLKHALKLAVDNS